MNFSILTNNNKGFYLLTILLCSLTLHIVNTQSVDLVGVVNVGEDAVINDTNVELFTVSVNEKNGELPITLAVYNLSSEAFVPDDIIDEEQEITVYCEVITPYTEGDTTVSFEPTVLKNTKQSDIQFDIGAQGRAVEVKCQGSSTTQGSLFQNSTQGSTGFVAVVKSPVVGFCQEMVVVPYLLHATYTEEVTLQLSEEVIGSDVNITCDVDPLYQGDDFLSLEFMDQLAPIGTSEITMAEPSDASCLFREYYTWINQLLPSSLIEERLPSPRSVCSPENEDDAWLLGVFVQAALGRFHFIFEGRSSIRELGNSWFIQMRYTILEKNSQPVLVSCTAQSLTGLQYLMDVSTGSKAMFGFANSSVQFVPFISDVVSSHFKSFLILGSPVEDGQVAFSCYLTAVNDSLEASFIAKNPVCEKPADQFIRPTATFKPPTDPPCVNSTCATTVKTPTASTQAASTQSTPSDGNSNWSLAESVIVFDPGDLFKEVEAVHENIGDAYRGLLVLTCCASADINQNPQYTNESAALLMVVDVAQDREINWNLAAVDGNLTDESEFPNPAYVEIGPCNCDLTEDHCDALCCCDMDCSEDDLALFPCLPGIPGGDFTEEWEYSCNNTDIFRPDWFPFLCVETVNKLFLGYYFSESLPGARDIPEFESLQSNLPTDYTTFEENEDRALDPSSEFSSSQGYQYGAPVQLRYENDFNGLLALPQQGASGSCLWTSAVKYQIDSNSTCIMNVTQEACSTSSALNARLFVQSSHTTHPPCPDPPEVISAFGYVTGKVSVSQVEYFCLDDLTGYLHSDKTRPVYGLYTESLPYVVGKQQASYSRCVWDDDFTRPLEPTYNSTTQACDHSVVEVQYEIIWQGGEILLLKGTVFIASVPASGILLNPMYSVKFSHQLPVTINDETGAVEIPEEPFRRSGNPGYQVGELLLSGTTIYQEVNISTPNPACNDSALNSTECSPATGDMEFVYVDTSFNSRLKYIASGSNGLCEDSTYEDITYGEDLMSGCIYRVGLSELDNCTILQQELETQLKALVQADRIAKIGNASSFNNADWITIFREPIEYEVVSTVEPYRERVNDELAELIGTCYHMPVGVHLHILYADAGMAKGLIQQEVVAAKISYQTRTLQLNCAGGNSASCQQNASIIGTERVQQFVLNNWVTFTKVPAVEPEPVIHYFKDVDESLCKQDKCPEEAFYPLTRAFMGDSFEHSLALWLTLILFGLGYFMVTKPWW